MSKSESRIDGSKEKQPASSHDQNPIVRKKMGRILVVEDDQDLLSALVQCLEEEQFEVRARTDGIGALDLIESEDIDILVLDLMLPFIGGLELCRRIRQRQTWIPIIMITALGDLGEKLAGFEVGADDYIAKPFPLSEFVARVKAIHRRGNILRPPFLEVGDITMDPLSRQAWRGDVDLELAPRESELLEMFLRRPGLVITRRSILQTVWSGDQDVSENIIDQYIGLLRKKIDRPFGRSDIETVHGLGYKLKCS